MGLLAVKFYKQVENPYEIPGEWPCESFPITSEKECPKGFVIMSDKEYQAHIDKHLEAKNEWNEKFYETKEYLGEE
jgi:hypothetical protein